MKARDLVIEVVEVRGECPVFKVGDRIVLRDGYRLDMDGTDALCSHAMGSLLPFLSPISRGIDPVSLGLSQEDGCGYVHCPDPGPPRTGGGTVVFRISPGGRV